MVRRWQSSEEILKELGENATEAAKSALAEGAELVMKEAKERCPVYTGNDRRVVKGRTFDTTNSQEAAWRLIFLHK